MTYQLLSTHGFYHYLKNNTRCEGATDISYFNFSGNGCFYLYNSFKDIEWSYPIKAGKSEFLDQIMFNSMWGTYAEDFGTLKFMTPVKQWKRRNELGDAFEKLGTQ